MSGKYKEVKVKESSSSSSTSSISIIDNDEKTHRIGQFNNGDEEIFDEHEEFYNLHGNKNDSEDNKNKEKNNEEQSDNDDDNVDNDDNSNNEKDDTYLLEIENNNNPYITKKFTCKGHKKVIPVLLFLLLSLLFSIGIMVITYKPLDIKKDILENEAQINENINEYYQQIILNINKDYDPCENMYQYSCGNWIDNFNVSNFTNNYHMSFSSLSELNNEKVLNILEKKWPIIGDFYSICIEKRHHSDSDLGDVIKVISRVNGIEEINNDYANEINYIKNNYGLDIDIYHKIYVDIDMNNSSNFILAIDEPSLLLPNKIITMNQII